MFALPIAIHFVNTTTITDSEDSAELRPSVLPSVLPRTGPDKFAIDQGSRAHFNPTYYMDRF